MASPYLKDDNRLADVIAAIQAMGLYKFYKLDFNAWADRIVADPEQGEYWRTIFKEHPEFFRLNENRDRASLVWRRQHQRRYDVDARRELTHGEYLALDQERRVRISRSPLSADEIRSLIDTATNLHARALERKKDSRWWVTGVIGLAGVIIGALLRALAG